MRIFEIKHLIHSGSRMRPLYSVVHFYKYKRTQLKHCYDDRAKLLLYRTQVLTFNTINFVVKNN